MTLPRLRMTLPKRTVIRCVSPALAIPCSTSSATRLVAPITLVLKAYVPRTENLETLKSHAPYPPEFRRQMVELGLVCIMGAAVAPPCLAP